ncbi:S8 family serine peptidase [Micromonospora mirobrigensis]|uniref:Serine protease n=1 Tax=Micromonospora mirobrigensis TaxID=262898 RepID=A0A1C4WCH3_9ACTN|nr:S8 family serine peptidase [Micromonospora mirobrigensis]SCE93915.1 serine protease [Micromonospora mirobrigensis]
MSVRTPMHLAVALATATALLPAASAAAAPPGAPQPATFAEPSAATSTFLVGVHPAGDRRGATAPARLADDLTAVGRATGRTLTVARVLATGDLVVRADRPLAADRSTAVLDQLRRRADVDWATADHRVHADTEAPAAQWDLDDPVGGVYLAPARANGATGAGVTVAVLDTGITAHPDLAANVVPGYDFVSSAADARDGDGRDADPTDQGDWQEPGDCGDQFRPSSWHGTHVAGTIAARDDRAGTVGVAPEARLQPVRVLGRCGGTTADLVDAIVWASGGSLPGVPDNPTPARVLNLSLGAPGSCDPATQAAVDAAVGRGVTVVVSAGNASADAAGFSPAGCAGVVTVAASDGAGERAGYSNRGTAVELAAPGGDRERGVLSTVNTGRTVAEDAGYAAYAGTSMAAPHVAGAAALLLGARPDLSPDRLTELLRRTARPAVRPDDCACGAGVLDVDLALRAATGHPGNTARVLLTAGVRPGEPLVDAAGVHLAGTLSRLGTGLPDWDPAALRLRRVGPTGPYRTVLTVPAGAELEYKYTLGGWDHVEQDYTDSDAGCLDVRNRHLTATAAGAVQAVDDLTGSFRGLWPCDP